MLSALGLGILTFTLSSVGMAIFFGLITDRHTKEPEIIRLSNEIMLWSFLLGLAVFLIKV